MDNRFDRWEYLQREKAHEKEMERQRQERKLAELVEKERNDN